MVTQTGPSKTVLEETPMRSLRFLVATGKYPAIWETLATRGYTQQDYDEGWGLFMRVSGYRQAPPPTTRNESLVAGVTELDAWVEPNLRIVRASLERHHPEQAAFVLSGLENGSGAAAMVTVVTLLDRLDLLQSSPGREATREADQAALATLARRGIGPDERARLRSLTALVLSPLPIAPAAVSPLDYEQALRRLRAWYAEWSEVARAVIKRRDHLILLGLARRRVLSSEMDPPAPARPQAPTAPTQTPAQPPAGMSQAPAGSSQPLPRIAKRSARPTKRSARPTKRSASPTKRSARTKRSAIVAESMAETAQPVSPPAPAQANEPPVPADPSPKVAGTGEPSVASPSTVTTTG